jgi:hypothetical protein
MYVALVMPDHVYLVLTPVVHKPTRSILPLHKILRSIKSFSARQINPKLGSRTLWQEESFDHVLRSSESLDAKIAYILANPVRAGLVVMEETRRIYLKLGGRAWRAAPTRRTVGEI